MIDVTAKSQILDLCVPRIEAHLRRNPSRPFILGISGLQGSGKSTWARVLTEELNRTYKINTRTVSLDDFYHDHTTLEAIKGANSENPLLRTRGQPGTHDETLAKEFLDSLDSARCQGPILIPSYDKSLFAGEGDRLPVDRWDVVSRTPRLEVVIFEGWCVGFQPLTNVELEAKVAAAKTAAANMVEPESDQDMMTNTLNLHSIVNLRLINDDLRRYCASFMGNTHFDALLHLDAQTLSNVYHWRLDQEHALRKQRGTGMSDERVIQFVRGYMPAYELYLAKLVTERFFPPGSGKVYIHLVLDGHRRVVKLESNLN